jgi:hypothetical protein
MKDSHGVDEGLAKHDRDLQNMPISRQKLTESTNIATLSLYLNLRLR